VVLALQVVGLVLVLAREHAAQDAGPQASVLENSPERWWRPSNDPPIVQPRAFAANAARIDPTEEVIGVEVEGIARAYRLGALASYRGHLVNDVVGATPVSVAYCNLSDCVTAYTGPRDSGPLALEVAGMVNLEMVLKVEGNLYYQKSSAPMDPAKSPPSMPLTGLKPVRTTWAEWQRLHPATDVYLGGPTSQDRAPKSQ
jgi:hypothetical protein